MNIMVSPRTLARIRRQMAYFLSDRCSILQRGVGSGHMGEEIGNWIPVRTDVPCRLLRSLLNTRNAREAVGGSMELIERFRLVLPHDVRIHQGNGVRIGDQVYEVVNIEDRLTDAMQVMVFITRAPG